ncbi:RsmB/NOP family class I SAM-dependent RNA methyltransferase [Candidatus Saccharibacteria bacterium]|nr:RsmB/NOP family class I SAM-dependent RNA methyltransferase [Candidatus Saccharibacteria bacterium]
MKHKKTTHQKRAIKRQTWLERTGRIFNISDDESERLLSQPFVQSIRINTLRPSNARELLLANGYTPISWYGDGLLRPTVYSRELEDALARDGHIYIQNAASWLPALALNPQPNEKILDMCAAPGGKTSHIAALTDNKSFITANDNSHPRLYKLQQNLQRLGVEEVELTLSDATKPKFAPPIYDAILLDAPCSGEGMMNLNNPKSLDSWSVAHIKRLQSLQKQLLNAAWRQLKPGGRLVYSTCTLAPEENEAIIHYALQRFEDISIQPLTLQVPTRATTLGEWNGKTYDANTSFAMRIKPTPYNEAFFVALLKKTA